MKAAAILASLVFNAEAQFPNPKQLEKMIPNEYLKAPQCKPFECSEEGQVPVQAFDKDDASIFHHGCDIGKVLDDVGLGMVNLYSMGMLKNTKLDKCCSKTAACYASCGMTMETCFNRFKSCADQATQSGNEMMGPVLKYTSMFLKDFPKKLNKDLSFAEARCTNFEEAQKRHCRCVDAADREDAVEEVVVAVYSKGGAGKEVEGDKDDLESPRSKKLGPIREKWIAEGTEAELFSALFTKFESRLVRKQKRDPIAIGDIPGVSTIAKMPFVQMFVKSMGVDLKSLGIEVDDDEEDEPEPEEDEFDDAEL